MSSDTPTIRKSALEQGYIARINQLKRTLDAMTNDGQCRPPPIRSRVLQQR
jgi:hypothetical protein